MDYEYGLPVNSVDVDRLHRLYDLIHQTQTLCDILRALTASLKGDTADISQSALTLLQRRMNPSEDTSMNIKNLDQKVNEE